MKWYLSAVLLLFGCQAGVQAPGSKVAWKDTDQKAPGNDSGVASTDLSPEQILGKDATALKAKYAINVDAIFNKICKGELEFLLKATPQKNGQLFDIPTGNVKCVGGLLGNFNLVEILAILAGGAEDSTLVMVKGAAIYLKALRQTTFSQPYRPFLPSFIAGSPEELATLDVTESIDAVHTVSKKVSHGSSHLKVLNFDQPLVSTELGVTLPKTMKFRMENSGFEDYEDRVGAMMFDVIEMEISLNPIAIVSMRFETKMKDLMQVGDKIGKFTGGDFGKLVAGNAKTVMVMKLIDQQNLKAQIAAMRKD